MGQGSLSVHGQCSLVSLRTGAVVSQGIGECNSYESKYRYREGRRVCPDCGQEAILKGKAEYGGGWLCWRKRDGCGGTWQDGDQKIEGQKVGRVINEDPADQINTLVKMAKKRALVDAGPVGRSPVRTVHPGHRGQDTGNPEAGSRAHRGAAGAKAGSRDSPEAPEEMGDREYDAEPPDDAIPPTFRSAGHFMWEASDKLGLKAGAGLPGPRRHVSGRDCRPAGGLGDSMEVRLMTCERCVTICKSEGDCWGGEEGSCVAVAHAAVRPTHRTTATAWSLASSTETSMTTTEPSMP